MNHYYFATTKSLVAMAHLTVITALLHLRAITTLLHISALV
jgi:hypothetical protein